MYKFIEHWDELYAPFKDYPKCYSTPFWHVLVYGFKGISGSSSVRLDPLEYIVTLENGGRDFQASQCIPMDPI